MAFVVSGGELAAVGPPPLPAFPVGVSVAEGITQSYAQIWRTQPQVRTVTSFLARNIAQLGLHTYRRVTDTDRVRVRDHPIAQLLGRPTPSTTTYRFLDTLVSDLAIYDNAVSVKVTVGTELRALQRVDPRRVIPIGDNPFAPDAYELRGSRGKRQIPADQVVHWRGYNPDDPRWGCSPMETLRRILAEEFEAARYREQLWRNQARASGYLRRPVDAPEWSDTAKSRFRAQWQSQFTGSGPQAGGTPILEDGMEFIAAASTARDAQYIESRKLTREEVAASFHIPLPMVGILDNATFCLPQDALVSTERGPVRIGDVAVGDRVWSVVDGALRTMPVTWSGQTGFKPLLTIRTQNRTLRCTDNHPVLTRRRVRIDTSEHPNRRRYRWDHAWVPAGELVVGDVIVTVAELPEHGGDTCPTRVVSEGFAEFCGLLLGDGNVMRSGGRAIGVTIARAKTAQYMDHYRSVMRAEFHRAAMGGRGTAATRERMPVTLIEDERATRFASVAAAAELVALGMSGTAFTKSVPEWVFGLAPKLRAAFVRGFLDADGSVDKKGRMSFASANEDMLRQIRELCIGLGVPVTNIRSQSGIGKLPNGRAIEFTMWTFTCSDPGANRIIGSHDPRYQQRLAAGVPFGSGSLSTYYEYRDRTGRTPIQPPDGCGHARVVAIAAADESVPVYDLTVDGSHNFVAEGVVVHNSNIREQHKQLYQDCLGPWLQMIQQEIGLQLLGDFGDTDGLYVEFNLAEKLRGSFEERAAQIQSSVGAPWMTRNEARALDNLPALDDADQLVVPLNVLVGGQASPNDVLSAAAPVRSVKARAPAAQVDKAAEVLSRFFTRQGVVVADQVGGGAKAVVDDVFDDQRWDTELAAELWQLNTAAATAAGRAALRGAGLDPDGWDEPRTAAWLLAAAQRVAGAMNAVTRAAVADALTDPDPPAAVRGLFDSYAGARAEQAAAAQVTAISGFGTTEAARQTGRDATKTWVVTSGNPRPSHASMDGETVKLDDNFSNGAAWPGDASLDVDDIAGCTCDLQLNFL